MSAKTNGDAGPSSKVQHVDTGWRGDPADIVTASTLDAEQVLAYRLANLREPWMSDALCAQPEHKGVDFFSTTKAGTTAALAVCGRCDVLAQCRQWACDPALPLTDGVAGGMTAAARRLVVRRRPGRKASC